MKKELKRGNILMQTITINHLEIELDHSEISSKDLDLKKDTDRGQERGEDHILEIEEDRIPEITKRAIIKKKEDRPENKRVQSQREGQVFINKQVTIVI
jgi:hypothetical protein